MGSRPCRRAPRMDGCLYDDPAADPKKRSFTPEYRLAIVEQLDAMSDPSTRGRALAPGRASSHIAEWRIARDAGALEGLECKPRAKRSMAELENEKLRLPNATPQELERTKLALKITGKGLVGAA